MNVLSFVSRKGGNGKTTLASNLAAAFNRGRHSCALIDLSPQTELANWEERSQSLPEIYDLESSELAEKLPVFSSRYDLVLIDTPPAFKDSALAAAQVADLVCIPVRVGGADIESVIDTLDLVVKHPMKEGCDIRLVLTQRRPNARYERTIKSLNTLNVDRIETEATMRRAYERALSAQSTVFDLSDAEHAVEEVSSIAYDLQHLLDDLPDPPQLDKYIPRDLLKKLHFEGMRTGQGPSGVLAKALGE